jgi:hypothetical protein
LALPLRGASLRVVRAALFTATRLIVVSGAKA